MKKIADILTKCIFAVYALLWLGIITLDLFFLSKDYTWRKTFLLSNLQILLLGGVAAVLFVKLSQLLEKNNIHIKRISINTLTAALFIAQIYIFYNIYFHTNGWDPSYIFRNAEMISRGDVSELQNWYFSMYPHNIGLTCFQAVMLYLNRIFGVWDVEGHFFLIIIQCFLSSLTGRLIYDNLRLLNCQRKYQMLGWVLYVILLGLSGWNIVTYTDMMGLIFPTAIFRIYLSLKNKKGITIKWLGIITLAFWGSKIKPTVLIAVIAIIISEAMWLLHDFDLKQLRVKLRAVERVLIAGGISIFLFMGVFNKAVLSAGFVIDKEASMGALNWVMMGLNPVNDGAYYYEDQKLSVGAKSKSERTRVQIDKIKERMHDYGLKGFIKHTCKKTLINYNDGTFAWGCEGSFYDVIYTDKNAVISPLLKSLYYDDGHRYLYLATAEQFAWILVLFGSIGIITVKRSRESAAIVLALIGVIMYNLIFEARARYVILYVPFFITAAMMTLQKLESYLNLKLGSRKQKYCNK